MTRVCILLIDDEPHEQEIFQHKVKSLAEQEISITQVREFAQAGQLSLNAVDFIFLDYGCTSPDTLDSALAELRKTGFLGGIIVMSNSPPQTELLQTITRDVMDNVDKRDIDGRYLTNLIAAHC